jgi:hypothetical protein
MSGAEAVNATFSVATTTTTSTTSTTLRPKACRRACRRAAVACRHSCAAGKTGRSCRLKCKDEARHCGESSGCVLPS